MLYCSRPPRPQLSPFIEAIWLYQGEPRPHALERIMPTGAAQLIVNLREDETRIYDERRLDRCERMSGAVLCGGHSEFFIIDTDEQQSVLGVSFKPGGTYPFLREPATETTNLHVPIELLWGRRRASILRDRVLAAPTTEAKLDAAEEVLIEALTRATGLHPAVTFALSAFGRVPHIYTVAEVTSTIGLSARHFIECFKTEVGFTPKAYCRIRRFQRALQEAQTTGRVDWSQVALACGYFDQAHFIHDFRAFSGLTPTGYHASRTEHQNHVKFLQSDVFAI